LFAQTSYCYKCEYARSVSDTPHRFVATVLYEVPFGKGKQMFNHGLGDAVLGGWEISSLVTVQSGFPLTALVGKDQSNTGVGFDRPNASGLPSATSNPTTGQWFNTAAYTLQPLGSFGNAGRNTITGPGIFQWDFSTLKNFRFAETRYLQFRFESFNAPNHPNWADPTTTLINPNFGKITSTRAAMRELQFALKLIF
jgi:hypothetical protein